MSSGAPVRHTPQIIAPGLEAVIARCLDVLTRRPAALITDIDGTLSHIVPKPEDATVQPAISRALESLTRLLDVVAVITAREEPVARRMVGAAHVTYIGNYGLLPGARVHADGIALAREQVRTALESMPGVELEDKGIAFSLHYRNSEHPTETRLRLLDLATPLAMQADARLVEGKKVLEMVPADLPTKRTAFDALIGGSAVRSAVFLGDDLSDSAVFREIRALSENSGFDGLGVAVIDDETDAEVLEAADITVDGVDQVGVLLAALVTRLPR